VGKLPSLLPDRLDKILVTGRFVVPALALLLLACKNSYLDGMEMKPFSLVTKEQFLGVAAGFLSNRLAIFLTEVRAEMRVEDVASFVPGSMAEAYRQSKKFAEANGKAVQVCVNVCVCVYVFVCVSLSKLRCVCI
jgi:hypothetical protein